MDMFQTPLLIASWICRIIASAILAQTLLFKFTGAEESVYIFTRMGMEPWGRYATGFAELLTAILLLVPRTAWAGAVLAAALMVGAVGSHLTVLRIVVKDDHGPLFGLALGALACSCATAYLQRHQFPLPADLM